MSPASAPLAAYRHWLRTSPALLAKAIRFTMIGLLSGVTFALTTAALVAGWGVDPVAASVVGYCVSVPTNFVGHRQFSFRSRGRWTAEAIRFLLVQLFNIALTIGTMRCVVQYFHAGYEWGMLATVIVVPVANFVFANLWVFRKQGFHSTPGQR